MTRAVAIQMDPPASLDLEGDATMLLALEAQRRGYRLFCYTPDRMSLRGGIVHAQAWPLSFATDSARSYVLGELQSLVLEKMDVVLMRQDPPFDMAYITATHLLERIHPKTLVVNDPFQVRNHPEKLFPLQFPEFVPPTLISADAQEIARFRKKHGEIVIKPLYSFGGRAVFHITPGDDNLNALLETVFFTSPLPVIVQPFLPGIRKGDRRVIMIDGNVAGAIRRIPAKGEIRSGLSSGGKATKIALDKRHREICDALGPVLREKGIIFASIDIIDHYLIEINITSPSSLVSHNELYGTRLERDVWNAVEKRL